MGPVDATHDEAAFKEEVARSLRGLGQGEERVLDAHVSLVQDVADAFAWKVTLVLPRPRGDTWDVDAALSLEDEARQVTDDTARRFGLEAEGLTSVVPTTHDAPAEDIGVDDGPQPGERPALLKSGGPKTR